MSSLICGLHHVGIVVDDLKKARAFYETVFGFEVVVEEIWHKGSDDIDLCVGLDGSAARGFTLRGANTFLELWKYEAPPATGGDPRHRGAHDLGMAHLCFQVSDFDAVQQRLLDAGGYSMKPVARAIPDFPRCHYFRDPFGNIIELIEMVDESFPRLSQLPSISEEGRFAAEQDEYLLIRQGRIAGRALKS
jgi:catechol 2,3-dioxygenase-like lactoylglutathione lyase family enzyme